MAVDDVLAASATRRGVCTLRFYQWCEPTLSLGYFQAWNERFGHRPSEQCPLVRRPSGGGAILHDHELTYSLALPMSHPAAHDVQQLYDDVHATLIDTLRELGADASLFADLPEQQQLDYNARAFLCFERRAAGDVVIGHHKVAGSAQRRYRHGVLQHGSVILRRSTAAPEIGGACDFGMKETTALELAQRWMPRLADRLGLNFVSLPLSPEEQHEAEHLMHRRYAAAQWTHAR